MLKARSQNSNAQSKTRVQLPPALLQQPRSNPSRKKAPIPTYESTPTTSISTEPPGRNGATQATQKLHDVIMPDMNSFEQQMKKSQKSGEGVTGMEWDDREMRETSVGKRRKRAFEVRSDQMDVDG